MLCPSVLGELAVLCSFGDVRSVIFDNCNYPVLVNMSSAWFPFLLLLFCKRESMFMPSPTCSSGGHVCVCFINLCMERVLRSEIVIKMFRWCSVSWVCPVSPECGDGVPLRMSGVSDSCRISHGQILIEFCLEICAIFSMLILSRSPGFCIAGRCSVGLPPPGEFEVHYQRLEACVPCSAENSRLIADRCCLQCVFSMLVNRPLNSS